MPRKAAGEGGQARRAASEGTWPTAPAAPSRTLPVLLSPVGSTPGAPVTWSRVTLWAPVLTIRPSAIHGSVPSPDVDTSEKLRPAVMLLPV